MAADLVYAAGPAGDIYLDYPVCPGILAKIIKIFTIFIDINKEWKYIVDFERAVNSVGRVSAF